MSKHKQRLGAAAIVGIVAVGALGLPSMAGQIGGYRACSSNQTVGAASGTYSNLIHTHRYESDSGTVSSWSSPTARTAWSTIGPYKNAHWRVSNGSVEGMKSGSSACIYLP